MRNMFALRQAGLGMGMREWYAEIGPVWYVPYVCVCIAAGGLGSGIREWDQGNGTSHRSKAR